MTTENNAHFPVSSSSGRIAVIVLAAGLGTRMKSALPKVMHPIGGRAMVSHLLETLDLLDPEKIVVVISEEPGMDAVEKAVHPHSIAIQKQQLGTGDAVKSALPALKGLSGDVLVTFGADPLICLATLEAMIDRRRLADNPAVVVLGFRPPDAGLYGRLVSEKPGTLEAIVEAKEATPEQLDIDLCNSGVMLIDGSRIENLLGRIDNKNAKIGRAHV